MRWRFIQVGKRKNQYLEKIQALLALLVQMNSVSFHIVPPDVGHLFDAAFVQELQEEPGFQPITVHRPLRPVQKPQLGAEPLTPKLNLQKKHLPKIAARSADPVSRSIQS